MKLEDYLEGMLEIRGQKVVRPKTLEMPKALLHLFSELFQMTEQSAVEHGCTLFYDEEGKRVFGSPIKSGNAFSMSIAKSSFDNNIGNVHAHPTDSIGHKGGFCAHSMQDLLTFEHELMKPFFMQFVVSGSKVYAVVYTRGLSIFGDEMKAMANQLKDSSVQEAKAYMLKKFGEDRYMDKISSFGSNQEAEKFLLDLKLSTPGLGKMMEKLSIEACMRIALRFKYAFYTGDVESFYSSSTLSLQE